MDVCTPTISSGTPLIITGMHRSGTSLLASALQQAGVAIGDRMLGADASNVRGHFEDLDFFELHESILADNGRTWHSVDERSPRHHQEWINACKGGPPAACNFEYAGPLTEVVLLGNLAIRTGQRVEWDAVNMCCPNVPEANEYLQHGYRAF